MPIITFLQDIFSAVKGPYHRKVGRHTQRFCSRAVKRSTNQMQRKTFFIVAICADEFIASLIGVDDKRQVEPFKGRTLQQKISKKQVRAALRMYMSAILTLVSAQKGLLLQQMHLDEQQLLHTWCSIFEYLPTDMQLFNDMLPEYQQGGMEGLCKLAGHHILSQLFMDNGLLSPAEMECLQKIMAEDATAVVRTLKLEKVEAV